MVSRVPYRLYTYLIKRLASSSALRVLVIIKCRILVSWLTTTRIYLNFKQNRSLIGNRVIQLIKMSSHAQKGRGKGFRNLTSWVQAVLVLLQRRQPFINIQTAYVMLGHQYFRFNRLIVLTWLGWPPGPNAWVRYIIYSWSSLLVGSITSWS